MYISKSAVQKEISKLAKKGVSGDQLIHCLSVKFPENFRQQGSKVIVGDCRFIVEI